MRFRVPRGRAPSSGRSGCRRRYRRGSVDGGRARHPTDPRSEATSDASGTALVDARRRIGAAARAASRDPRDPSVVPLCGTAICARHSHQSPTSPPNAPTDRRRNSRADLKKLVPIRARRFAHSGMNRQPRYRRRFPNLVDIDTLAAHSASASATSPSRRRTTHPFVKWDTCFGSIRSRSRPGSTSSASKPLSPWCVRRSSASVRFPRGCHVGSTADLRRHEGQRMSSITRRRPTPDGKPARGSRWRARYRDPSGRTRSKTFERPRPRSSSDVTSADKHAASSLTLRCAIAVRGLGGVCGGRMKRGPVPASRRSTSRRVLDNRSSQ